MTRIREIKTTFTAGEVTPNLLGRGDLRAYDNGALTLRNVFINPTGGVKRRAGLSYIDTAAGDGRLISFEFNVAQTYLLVVTNEQIDIYAGGSKDATISAPWTTNQIKQLVWTQSADTLLLTHPEVAPKQLTRQSDGSWALNDWSFFEEHGLRYQPYYKYAGSAVTLTPSGTSGTITLTASENVFAQEHEGTRIRFRGYEFSVDDYDSPTVITATMIGYYDEDEEKLLTSLTDTSASIDWQEQAFSEVYGYPSSVAFHQDRLVIGGSRDLPNRMWFSNSGDLFNFDLGDGLDDESIEFSILSDQVNAIRGIFSGRHLQVFTSGAEWMIEGSPLTPTSIDVLRQTRIGSVIDRYIPPVNVDGATLYIARNKKEVYEYLYTDLEEAYVSTDLALLSHHVVKNPIDQDYDQSRRLLFIVREDGKFATLTVYRSEQVSAWTLHETDGNVRSVSVVGDEVYVLVERDGTYMIEEFEDNIYLDSALSGEVTTATTNWSGLDHLEGKTVNIIADDIVQDSQKVVGGSITLSEAANSVTVGLPYTHIIQPLPPSETGQAGGSRKIRLVEAVFRLYETAALRLDIGRGPSDIALRQVGSELLDEPLPLISKDIKVHALGWQKDGQQPLWRIEQDTPLSFELLSVTTQIKVND